MSALTDKINVIVSGISNLSAITFPDAEQVIKTRIMATHGLSPEIVNPLLFTDSPALRTVNTEIMQAQTYITMLMSQMPFLSVPITAATAMNNIRQMLPLTIGLLNNIGIDPPSPLEPVLDAIGVAETMLTTAATPLTGLLSPLKSILGL